MDNIQIEHGWSVMQTGSESQGLIGKADFFESQFLHLYNRGGNFCFVIIVRIYGDLIVPGTT